MKTIGNVSEVLALEKGLSTFVSTVCHWIHDSWNPEQIGWIFVLGEHDLEAARSLCIVPNSDSMTIDLETFDMWEGDAIQDSITKYWNVVGIVGQEYGFSLFVSNDLVQQLPRFRRYITKGG